MTTYRPPLGQHFLRDERVVKTILAAAELKSSDTALEIGPGKGVLTELLADRVRGLTAVELDGKLATRLCEKFKNRPHIRIIQGDILKVDLSAISPRPIKILGNLPYSITSPIFEKLMPWPGWGVAVFLIQREVAERIKSQPGSRTYGILTLAVQLFAEVESVLQVKPGAFAPPPDVLSSVIRLRRKETPLLPQAFVPDFFDLAHGAFAHRRKTVANSLALFTRLRREEIEKWLARHEVDPRARAETLGLQDYARLAIPWSIFRREINLT